MSEQSLSSQIFTRKMLICVFTGFSSGLPLFVLLQMLPVWLTDKKLSVELIGALTGVMVPYGLKFLWAPLLDRYFPHFLGRRRSWFIDFSSDFADFPFMRLVSLIPWQS